MKKILSIVLSFLWVASQAIAQDGVGASAPPSVTVNGQSLLLNGAGAREKSAFDGYAGSLYTPKRVSTEEELFQEPGDKLLRLDILRDKVEKEKIMGVFEEGFSKSAPDIARSPDAKRFLTLFKADFYKGDKVELFLGGDGTVAASHNGLALGTVKSSPLVRGILKSWFSKKPTDEKLKDKIR